VTRGLLWESPNVPACRCCRTHPLGGPPWGGDGCSDGSRKRLVGKPGSASERVNGSQQVLGLLVVHRLCVSDRHRCGMRRLDGGRWPVYGPDLGSGRGWKRVSSRPCPTWAAASSADVTVIRNIPALPGIGDPSRAEPGVQPGSSCRTPPALVGGGMPSSLRLRGRIGVESGGLAVPRVQLTLRATMVSLVASMSLAQQGHLGTSP
jgi:hypothetical protein